MGGSLFLPRISKEKGKEEGQGEGHLAGQRIQGGMLEEGKNLI